MRLAVSFCVAIYAFLGASSAQAAWTWGGLKVVKPTKVAVETPSATNWQAELNRGAFGNPATRNQEISMKGPVTVDGATGEVVLSAAFNTVRLAELVASMSRFGPAFLVAGALYNWWNNTLKWNPDTGEWEFPGDDEYPDWWDKAATGTVSCGGAPVVWSPNPCQDSIPWNGGCPTGVTYSWGGNGFLMCGFQRYSSSQGRCVGDGFQGPFYCANGTQEPCPTGQRVNPSTGTCSTGKALARSATLDEIAELLKDLFRDNPSARGDAGQLPIPISSGDLPGAMEEPTDQRGPTGRPDTVETERWRESDGEHTRRKTTSYNYTYSSTHTMTITTTIIVIHTYPDGHEENETPPENQEAMCEKYPHISACQPLTPVESQELPTDEIDISSLTPELSAAGSCPGDRELTVLGRPVVWSWQALCTFASGIRPFVLAFAWVGAALLVGVGIRKYT